MSATFVRAFSISARSSGETAAEKDNMTKLQPFHDASSPAKIEAFPSTRMSTIEAAAVDVPAADSKDAILLFAACKASPARCKGRSNCSSRSSETIVIQLRNNVPKSLHATLLRYRGREITIALLLEPLSRHRMHDHE